MTAVRIVRNPEPSPAEPPPSPPSASSRAAAGSTRLWLLLLGVTCIVAAIANFLWVGMPPSPGLGSPAPRAQSVPPRFEASSGDFEMVGVLEEDQLVFYLADYIGNGPRAGAKLTVQIDDRTATVTERGGGVYAVPFGDVRRTRQAAVTVEIDLDGTQDLLGGALDVPGVPSVAGGSTIWRSFFAPAPWLLAIGAFLIGLVASARIRAWTAAAVAAMVLLGGSYPAEAHPGHGEGQAGIAKEDLASSGLPPNSPRRLSNGSLFVPKQAQFILGIRTALAQSGEATRSLRLVGRVVADPAASGTVQSSLIGRVELPPEGMPRVGQRVTRGQVLASVVPVINPLDRGNIQQQISMLDQELIALQRADEPSNGNGGDSVNDPIARQAAVSRAAQMEALMRRRTAMNRVLVDREGLRIPLRAPTDGVISVASAIAGQIVEARDTLYEIVDPDRVWVEAAAYDVTTLSGVAGAAAVTRDGRSMPLAFLGYGPKLTQQAIPLLFHVREPVMLPIGTPVSVLVETRQKQSGIILPPAAVIRNSAGQTIVWQHAGAEHFIPLVVRVEPIDGRSVAVLAGLPDDRRVVVVGADLLNQIR